MQFEFSLIALTRCQKWARPSSDLAGSKLAHPLAVKEEGVGNQVVYALSWGSRVGRSGVGAGGVGRDTGLAVGNLAGGGGSGGPLCNATQGQPGAVSSRKGVGDQVTVLSKPSNGKGVSNGVAKRPCNPCILTPVSRLL
jgi:hypothetical protein